MTCAYADSCHLTPKQRSEGPPHIHPMDAGSRARALVYGLAFTVGRGNDVEVAAVQAVAKLAVGLPVDDVLGDLGAFSRRLTGDSQLRWLGPEKGAIHMAAAAIVDAVWDLYGRREGKPVWQLLAGMEPERLVDLVDFHYLREVLTREEALEILQRAASGRAGRTARLLSEGVPAYTTTPGWLGYSDSRTMLSASAVRLAAACAADPVRGLARQAVSGLARVLSPVRPAR